MEFRIGMRLLIAGLALLAGGLASPAFAHPHIFIDARVAIRFDDAGRLISVRNSWTFDEAYSAWSIQGLDTNLDGVVSGEELQPLADDNMDGLAEYKYYTFAGEGAESLAFTRGSDASIDYAGQRSTLEFDVALDRPYAIRQQLELAINDPEYYVAITFAGPEAVRLVNAPANCSARLEPPQEMPDDIANWLYALPADVTTLPPELEEALRGVQGAILIDCPGGSATGVQVAEAAPETALDAATQLAETPAAGSGGPPLGGPPPEPGLSLPRTGVLGWVAQQQADFYRIMVAALDALRTDWTAFWLLGGLSFLYGIFHAAGPGHGKVVISSYVLANEAQVKRGIWLSFLSAMLQSAVAIGFVLVAALVLQTTSFAMNDAAHWIGVASYALVAGLGLWLVARKLFGLGHGHRHEHGDDMRRLARRHLGEHAHDHRDPHHDHHEHAHVVTPARAGGSWREQAGVVLGVGLRPCSGALVVLAFALSQGLLAAGIVAVLLMGLGTAITTGALGALAVGAKGVARRLAGADNIVTVRLLWGVELLAAFAVLAFGVVLLLASL
jgi:nickel/cobalt exporter